MKQNFRQGGEMVNISSSRRQFLSSGAILTTCLFLPKDLLAGTSARILSIYEPNTQKSFNTVYWRDGWYLPDSLYILNDIFKDLRSGEVTNIDPGLFDLLWLLQKEAQGRLIHLTCGYRSAITNAQMARRSRGVARNSMHIYGKAADIRIPGYSSEVLHEKAIELAIGGVGFYPSSNFVHVDTGEVRTWQGD